MTKSIHRFRYSIPKRTEISTFEIVFITWNLCWALRKFRQSFHYFMARIIEDKRRMQIVRFIGAPAMLLFFSVTPLMGFFCFFEKFPTVLIADNRGFELFLLSWFFIGKKFHLASEIVFLVLWHNREYRELFHVSSCFAMLIATRL